MSEQGMSGGGGGESDDSYDFEIVRDSTLQDFDTETPVIDTFRDFDTETPNIDTFRDFDAEMLYNLYMESLKNDLEELGDMTSSVDQADSIPRLHDTTNQLLSDQPPASPAPFPRWRPRLSYDQLPAHFFWGDVGGVNYLDDITYQGICGSCFAITTSRMFAARLRVMTGGGVSKTFSPQDIVSCSPYAQKCHGGIPYLVGKYAEDFGFVDEDCFPYTASDEPCSHERKGCPRYYGTDYKYIGGYYGGCNIPDMMTELVNDGPITASIYVSSELTHYQSGIFKHTGIEDEYNGFEPVNHSTLIVGYGEEGGVKYWICQNTWGKDWGEEGYFRIARGENEANIESSAVSATLVT